MYDFPRRISILNRQLLLAFWMRAHAALHRDEFRNSTSGPPPAGCTRSMTLAPEPHPSLWGFFPVQEEPLHEVGAAAAAGRAGASSSAEARTAVREERAERRTAMQDPFGIQEIMRILRFI
ncbi:hypothetical protein GCM10009601_27780 [Streptomyces thermospinosisporus]|uniref:Uncharacterized protein n=1 Tax=Streptomyces thermospinosisporus TaxID=161482 RepID=A0ABP4JL93_9ACTN